MAVRLPECERKVSGALRQGADFVFVKDVQQNLTLIQVVLI